MGHLILAMTGAAILTAAVYAMGVTDAPRLIAIYSTTGLIYLIITILMADRD